MSINFMYLYTVIILIDAASSTLKMISSISEISLISQALKSLEVSIDNEYLKLLILSKG